MGKFNKGSTGLLHYKQQNILERNFKRSLKKWRNILMSTNQKTVYCTL